MKPDWDARNWARDKRTRADRDEMTDGIAPRGSGRLAMSDQHKTWAPLPLPGCGCEACRAYAWSQGRAGEATQRFFGACAAGSAPPREASPEPLCRCGHTKAAHNTGWDSECCDHDHGNWICTHYQPVESAPRAASPPLVDGHHEDCPAHDEGPCGCGGEAFQRIAAGSAPAEPLTEDVRTADIRVKAAENFYLKRGLSAQDAIQHLLAVLDDLRAALATQQAELDVLRGVHCEADGDGPCGVCLKCKERRWATQQAAIRDLVDSFKRSAADHRTLAAGHPNRAVADWHQNCAATYEICAESLAKLLDAEPGAQ